MLNQRNALIAGTLVLALGTVAPLAQAQNGQNGNTQQQDQQQEQQQEQMTPENFVDGASAINSGELDGAEMALDKDEIPAEVKQYAQHMQQDHTQANQKLQQIADSKNLDMSSTANMSSMASAPKLMVQDGQSFSTSYIDQQVTAHQEAIDFFQRGADTLQDQELKQYATEMLPTLKEHLQMAQELQKKLANQ